MECEIEKANISRSTTDGWHFITTNSNLNLTLTFNSGQVFHFIETTQKEDLSSIHCEWTGCIYKNIFSFQQNRDGNIYFKVINDNEQEDLKDKENLANIPKTSPNSAKSSNVISIEDHRRLLTRYFSLDKDYPQLLRDWVLKITSNQEYSNNLKSHILNELFNSSYFMMNLKLDCFNDIMDAPSPDALKEQILRSSDDFSGLRILNPCLLQTIFSFICSQNNHIKRIKKMVHILYRMGRKIAHYKGIDFHIFPDLTLLANNDILNDLKSFGYRKIYIVESAKKLLLFIKQKSNNTCGGLITQNEVNCVKRDGQPVKKRIKADSKKSEILIEYEKHISAIIYDPNPILKYFSVNKEIDDFFLNCSYSMMSQFLRTLPGISHKVSDCILLYGANFSFVVPFDAHMIKIGRSFFSNTKDKPKNFNQKELISFRSAFFEVFGDEAGLAQLFLFDRSVKERVEKIKHQIRV